MLKDVKYIPELKKMLISVGQFDKEGYLFTFRDEQWKVIKENLVIARGEKKIGLCTLLNNLSMKQMQLLIRLSVQF